MTKIYTDAGIDVSMRLFPKSNHYFSHNGRIVGGKAYNGCSDDPIVICGRGDFKTASGKPVSVDEIRAGRCFTATAGSEKSREDLNDAVDTALDFFDKYRTNLHETPQTFRVAVKPESVKWPYKSYKPNADQGLWSVKTLKLFAPAPTTRA